jgi:hypothetical protein
MEIPSQTLTPRHLAAPITSNLLAHDTYDTNISSPDQPSQTTIRTSSMPLSDPATPLPTLCLEYLLVWAKCAHSKAVLKRINCPAFPQCVCANNPVLKPVGLGHKEQDASGRMTGLCGGCRDEKARREVKKPWKKVEDEMGGIELRRY